MTNHPAHGSSPKDGLKNEEQTPSVHGNDQAVHTYPAQDIEIKNRDIPTKPRTNISGLEITDEIKAPEEKIVYIKRPVAERKKEIVPKPEREVSYSDDDLRRPRLRMDEAQGPRLEIRTPWHLQHQH